MKSSDRNGKAVVDGVTIAWSDSRYMGSDYDDPTGDMDLRGEYRVSITVANGEISEIHHAIECARRLKMLASACDVHCPVPGSEHVLRLAGLDNMGAPVWRVVVAGRAADAIPAADMSTMDPAAYSDAGPTAMRVIAWMRAVGQITSDWKTKEETWHVLHVWDAATLAAALLQFCQPPARELGLK